MVASWRNKRVPGGRYAIALGSFVDYSSCRGQAAALAPVEYR